MATKDASTYFHKHSEEKRLTGFATLNFAAVADEFNSTKFWGLGFIHIPPSFSCLHEISKSYQYY